MIFPNITIFKAGTTNDGRKISNQDIADLYAGTIQVSDEWTPAVYLSRTGGHQTVSGEIRDGNLRNLRTDGETITADVEIINPDIAQMIQDKRITNGSIETMLDYICKTGHKVKKFITGLALLGRTMPAISDVMFARYESLEGQATERAGFAFEFADTENTGGHKMEYEKMYHEEFTRRTQLENENKTLKTEIDALKPKFETFQSQTSALTEENKKLKATVDSQSKTVETFETQLRDNFIGKLIEDKFILPKQKDSVVEMFTALKTQFGREDAEKKISAMFSVPLNIHSEAFTRGGGDKSDSPESDKILMSDHSVKKEA